MFQLSQGSADIEWPPPLAMRQPFELSRGVGEGEAPNVLPEAPGKIDRNGSPRICGSLLSHLPEAQALELQIGPYRAVVPELDECALALGRVAHHQLEFFSQLASILNLRELNVNEL